MKAAALILRLVWLLPLTAAALAVTVASISGILFEAVSGRFRPADLLLPLLAAASVFLIYSVWKDTVLAAMGKRPVSLARGALGAGAVVLAAALFVPKLEDFALYSIDGRQKGSLSYARMDIEKHKEEAGRYYTGRAEVEAVLNERAPKKLWDSFFNLYHHEPTRELVLYSSPENRDSGKWAYVNDPASPAFGQLYIDCSHRSGHEGFDKPWSAF